MHAMLLLLMPALVGVDAGWVPLTSGGHEYTIQIEPSLLSVLEEGHDLVSEIPPQIDVRRYRITVGTGKLERTDGPIQRATDERPPQDWRADSDAPPFQATPPSAAQPGEFSAGAYTEPLPGRRANYDQPDRQADDDEGRSYITDKPALPAESAETVRAWWPLALAAVLLCCSLGGNIYLGWVAWEARARHRDMLARLRPASAGRGGA